MTVLMNVLNYPLLLIFANVVKECAGSVVEIVKIKDEYLDLRQKYELFKVVLREIENKSSILKRR